MQRKQSVIFVLVNFLAISQSQTTVDSNCGENTVRVPPCVDACPPTCVQPNPQICSRICLLDGCVCQKGFIRTENRFSPCIPETECPRNGTKPVKCRRNEVPYNCSPPCERACNRNGRIFCPLITCGNTARGCICARGFVRRDYRETRSPCIPESKCPCTKPED